MKKILSVFVFLFLLGSQGTLVSAADSKAAGLELSGNVDTVVGYQHDDSSALGTAIGGQLGEFRGSTAPSHDTFNFYLDQVELDLNKTFGQNIRIRADLDFGRQLSGSARNTNTAAVGISNFELEQGYITFNVKGAEFLVGRFNVPIGYYVVDRADNPTISFSTPFKYLTPTNATGAKIYYAFNDRYDWHVYVINSLSDGVAFGFPSVSGTTPNPGAPNPGAVGGGFGAIPSYGTRFGFNWGKEDTKSTLGISYAGGPNRFGCNGGATSCNAHLTHLADLDFAVKFTPKFLFAGEGVFRQDNADPAGLRNDRSFGGFFVINYDWTDKWRVYLRGGYLQDRNGFYTGGTPGAVGTAVTPAIGENIYDFAVGAGYQITDGAKMKVEYAPTIFDPRGTGSGGVGVSLSHGFALEFAYNF
jgi:hypothetical protein